MLDVKIDSFFPIHAVTGGREQSSSNSLLIRECKVIFSNERIYSELEEQALSILNSNNGLGAIDVEFVFENNIIQESYPVFYTKCFIMRTDTGGHIKPMKDSNEPSYSKVDQDGRLVVGIRYYFKSEKEIEEIVNCSEFLVEGYIALGKPKNVFGVMCKMKKIENGWEFLEAYTYKAKYAKNIKNLMD